MPTFEDYRIAAKNLLKDGEADPEVASVYPLRNAEVLRVKGGAWVAARIYVADAWLSDDADPDDADPDDADVS